MRLSLSLMLMTAVAVPANAQVFSSGIPAGYNCAGMCSTAATPDGSITPVPTGSARVGYVTTHQSGNTANPLGIASSTNGSQLYSSPFTGVAGQTLSFYFDYITSDGAGFSDYAYVQLLGLTTGTMTLFTARTNAAGAVPGFGLPGIAPGVTLNPATVNVIPNASFFSGLSSSSGACWALGCGNTDWVTATYSLVATDTYKIMFGVNNLNDGGFQSALLFDYDAGPGGVPTIAVVATPEPSSLMLAATGLALVAAGVRRRTRTD